MTQAVRSYLRDNQGALPVKRLGVILGNLSWMAPERIRWHAGRAYRQGDTISCDNPDYTNVMALGPSRTHVWGSTRRRLWRLIHYKGKSK